MARLKKLRFLKPANPPVPPEENIPDFDESVLPGGYFYVEGVLVNAEGAAIIQKSLSDAFTLTDALAKSL